MDFIYKTTPKTVKDKTFKQIEKIWDLIISLHEGYFDHRNSSQSIAIRSSLGDQEERRRQLVTEVVDALIFAPFRVNHTALSCHLCIGPLTRLHYSMIVYFVIL